MFKAFKYRIYPTDEQKVLMEKHFGCVRLIYNLGLSAKQMAYSGNKKNVSRIKLQEQLIDLKNEFDWMKEVNSQSLQSSLKNLDTAFVMFFKKISRYPQFKSKRDKQSFQCPQFVTLEDNKLFLPKFKEPIEILLHRKFKGKIKTVTISKAPSGKYFASILVDTSTEVPTKKLVTENTAVGIDLGIKTFVVISDGTSFEKPKHLHDSIYRLKYLQRQLSRKKKGSKRYEKFCRRIAKLHEKIANQRKDFLHKVSYAITKQYDTICMEDLKVRNMMKNHKLAQAIGDCGWGYFKEFVKYKSEWNGKNFLQINPFAPSSKTCSVCGQLNKHLTLADREWICESCGTHHDRDKNASINIKQFALKNDNGVAVRTRQDTEASPLLPRKRKSMRAVEVSKIHYNDLPLAS